MKYNAIPWTWKTDLISNCATLVSSAKMLLLECGTACPDGVKQKVDLIEKGLNWARCG